VTRIGEQMIVVITQVYAVLNVKMINVMVQRAVTATTVQGMHTSTTTMIVYVMKIILVMIVLHSQVSVILFVRPAAALMPMTASHVSKMRK
jgi:hypothetical protein